MKATEIAIIFITGTLTLLVFILFLVLIIIAFRRRQVRHIMEKLELKHQYQNQVLQTKVEVQEESFKHFSEEVHDNIAQMLALSRMRLYKIADKTQDEVTKNGIEATAEMVGKILNDLRNLSHVLNGGLVSKIPLAESLAKELDSIKYASDIDTQLSISGTVYELDGEKKLLVFRILQEAMGNAVKHGKATLININLVYETGLLIVEITDNGKGFDTKLLNESKGLGLYNMQIRAKMLGQINISSESGNGTKISLKIKTNE